MSRLALAQIRKKLRDLASPSRKTVLKSFFKCGRGEYAEGDEFLGVSVPQVRRLIPLGCSLSFHDLRQMLGSKFHEERMLALLSVTENFQIEDEAGKKKYFDFYLQNRSFVNNWDLVDLTAYKIVGAYLEKRPKHRLYQLAKSKKMWDRRIAIVSTLHFIRHNDFQTTFNLAHLLINDREDLMHKACGWMLREAGKKDQRALEKFLKNQARKMPRTMLRYAIEKFPESKRQFYLKTSKIH